MPPEEAEWIGARLASDFDADHEVVRDQELAPLVGIEVIDLFRRHRRG